MKTCMAILSGVLFCGSALAQTYQYTGTLTGTETLYEHGSPGGPTEMLPVALTLSATVTRTASTIADPLGYDVTLSAIDASPAPIGTSGDPLFPTASALTPVAGPPINVSLNDSLSPDPIISYAPPAGRGEDLTFSIGGSGSATNDAQLQLILNDTCENACGMLDVNTSSGTWSVSSPEPAPEISPAGATGALSLLAGLLAIARARRQPTT